LSAISPPSMMSFRPPRASIVLPVVDALAHTLQRMFRLRLGVVLLLALVLVACSANASCKPCKSGLTFVLDRIAGSLSRGTQADISICVDGTCKTETVTRDAASHSVFVEAGGLGGKSVHTITVRSKSGTTIDGSYTGPIEMIDNSSSAKCSNVCKVGVVKVEDNGTPVPGVPSKATASSVAPSTTAPG
jgi:hypothetical protein